MIELSRKQMPSVGFFYIVARGGSYLRVFNSDEDIVDVRGLRRVLQDSNGCGIRLARLA